MRRQHRQRGHAMIELAFSASVMIACLAGTFQFGYTFYVYDELVTAVGSGARYAASRTYRAASPADIEKAKDAIRNLVVYGNSRPAADAAPVAPNLKPENVQVTWVTPVENGPPAAVDVSISKYTVGAIFGSVTIDHRPMAEFPFVGRYAPSESEP
ncbi:MAG TPA: TadE family protein [Bryobacteraceae bacterium]|jgi:Flp pilus assembly protein TadG